MKIILRINILAIIGLMCFGSVAAQTTLAEEAKSALNSGNNTKAIELYDQLIQSADKYAPSYYARGLAKYKLRNFDEAIVDFNQAASIDSNYYMAFYGLALCYFEKVDYRKVLFYYQKVKNINVKFAPIYYLKGLALYMSKDFPQANMAFGQALRFDDKYYKAHYANALCMRELQLVDGAIKELKYYISMVGNQDGLQAECDRLINEMQNELNK